MEQLRRLFQEGVLVLVALVGPGVRSVRENAGLAAFSVVLAFGLWIFVTDTENPTRTGVLPLDLTVEPVNVPADLAVANELATVRVRVRVAEDVWENLTAADFEATVDSDGLQAGVYDAPVGVRTLTGRGGLRITGVIPDTVEVDLEPLFSKSVPVVVEVEGTPPSGFTMGQPESSDESALVTGPQQRVSLVSQAAASLDVTGRTDAVRQAVRLEPRDQRGFLVQGVSLMPTVTRVSIDIEETEFSRTLVVSPEVRGTPAQGYNVVGVTVSPVAVTVFGPQSFVQEAAVIRTQPVDISGASADVVRSVSLDLPPGTSVHGGVSVTVTVSIEAASGEVSFGVPVGATGLGEGLSIVGSLPTVQARLRGPLPALLEVRPSDVVATLDLSGLQPGAHTVQVKVSAPAGLLVASVSPAEVQVILEKR